MSNNGITFKGNDNTINGDVINTVTINKNFFKIIVTITISLLVILSFFSAKYFSLSSENKGINLLGTWYTHDGNYIEFFSDGTIDTNIHNVQVNPDTYEILEEGYLKWGSYDPSWIQYFYTYWDIDYDGNTLILTSRDDNNIISLTKK